MNRVANIATLFHLMIEGLNAITYGNSSAPILFNQIGVAPFEAM
jgi:hypothetical protein